MSDALLGVVAVVFGLAAGTLAPWLTTHLPPPVTDDDTEPARPSYRKIGSEPLLRWGALALGPVVAAGLAWRLPSVWHAGMWAVALGPLLALAYIDARTKLLPTRIVVPTTLGVLAVAVVFGALSHQGDLIRALIGMVLARSLLWVLWWLRSAGMGFGDVRLSALLGLLLAAQSWTVWLAGLYGATVLFALYGVGRAVARRSSSALKDHLPFGPFLIAGAIVAALWDPQALSLVGG